MCWVSYRSGAVGCVFDPGEFKIPTDGFENKCELKLLRVLARITLDVWFEGVVQHLPIKAWVKRSSIDVRNLW